MRTAKIELFRDVNRCWRWRIVGGNGEVLATSEAYSSMTQCKDTARLLAKVTALEIVRVS